MILFSAPPGGGGPQHARSADKVKQSTHKTSSTPIKGRVHYVSLGDVQGPLSKAVDIERMTYDPTTDSLWLATLVHPKQVTVYRYDIQSGGSESFTVPTKDRTGNLWSGGLAAGARGTVWLAFANTVARKPPGSSKFHVSSLPPPYKSKGQVAGIWGIAAVGDDLWVSRHKLQHLTRFSASDGTSTRMMIQDKEATRGADGKYPNRLAAIPDGSLLVLFGTYAESPTSAGIIDTVKRTLRPLPGEWPALAAAMTNDSFVTLSYTSPGNIKFLSALDGAVTVKTPYAGLAAKANTDSAPGGLAIDRVNQLAWFFVVVDKTRDESENFGNSNPKKVTAFFLRTNADGTRQDRYAVPLPKKTIKPFSGSHPLPSSDTPDTQRRKRLPATIETVDVPGFEFMVIDKRGDLWALASGSRLVKVDAR